MTCYTSPNNGNNSENKEHLDIVLLDVRATVAKREVICTKKNLYADNTSYVCLSYRWKRPQERPIYTEDYFTGIQSFSADDLVELCRYISYEPDLSAVPFLFVDHYANGQLGGYPFPLSNIYRKASYWLAVPDLHFCAPRHENDNAYIDYFIAKEALYVYYTITNNTSQLKENEALWMDQQGIPKRKEVRQSVKKGKVHVNEAWRRVWQDRCNRLDQALLLFIFYLKTWSVHTWWWHCSGEDDNGSNENADGDTVTLTRQDLPNIPKKYWFMGLCYEQIDDPYDSYFIPFDDERNRLTGLRFFDDDQVQYILKQKASLIVDYLNDNSKENNSALRQQVQQQQRQKQQQQEYETAMNNFLSIMVEDNDDARTVSSQDRCHAILPMYKVYGHLLKNTHDDLSTRLKLFDVMTLREKVRLLFACSRGCDDDGDDDDDDIHNTFPSFVSICDKQVLFDSIDQFGIHRLLNFTEMTLMRYNVTGASLLHQRAILRVKASLYYQTSDPILANNAALPVNMQKCGYKATVLIPWYFHDTTRRNHLCLVSTEDSRTWYVVRLPPSVILDTLLDTNFSDHWQTCEHGTFHIC